MAEPTRHLVKGEEQLKTLEPGDSYVLDNREVECAKCHDKVDSDTAYRVFDKDGNSKAWYCSEEHLPDNSVPKSKADVPLLEGTQGVTAKDMDDYQEVMAKINIPKLGKAEDDG